MTSGLPAPFSAADIDFIRGLQDTLRRDVADGREYGGLVTTLLRRLECLQDASIQKSPSWGSPVVCVPDASSAKDQSVLRITGPLPDDHFEMAQPSPQITSEVVRYVSALDAACKKIQEIRTRSLAVVQKQQELEQEKSGLSGPSSQAAEVTVDDHIRLLRQYNKTKDVGQQLIGLIAESRNVALGTVYKDGEYGVCADD